MVRNIAKVTRTPDFAASLHTRLTRSDNACSQNDYKRYRLQYNSISTDVFEPLAFSAQGRQRQDDRGIGINVCSFKLMPPLLLQMQHTAPRSD